MQLSNDFIHGKMILGEIKMFSNYLSIANIISGLAAFFIDIMVEITLLKFNIYLYLYFSSFY